MTCAEADSIKQNGPQVVVERLDGVARVILTCSVDQAELRCARQLAEGHPEREGLKLGMGDNFSEEMEIMYGLFTSFGESGAASARACGPRNAEALPPASPEVTHE